MRTLFAGFVAIGLLSVASAAGNQTVTFTVPVDLSALPYIETFSVQCWLWDTPPQHSDIDSVGPGHGRVDKPLSNGEFHGAVSVTAKALPGHSPKGYNCQLYLFSFGESMGFKPVPAEEALASTPPQHVAAPGTVTVTNVQGTFGPKRGRPMLPLSH